MASNLDFNKKKMRGLSFFSLFLGTDVTQIKMTSYRIEKFFFVGRTFFPPSNFETSEPALFNELIRKMQICGIFLFGDFENSHFSLFFRKFQSHRTKKRRISKFF